MKTKIILAFIVSLVISASTSAQENNRKNEKASKRNDVSITKEKLLEAKTIDEILPGFSGKEFEIVSYQLTIIPNGGDLIEFLSKNNQVSNEMKEKIKSLPGGSSIFVEYIKGRLKNNTDKAIRSVSAVSFILNEK